MAELLTWHRLAALTLTPEILQAFDAVGLPDPPPEGRPQSFRAYRDDNALVSVRVEHYKDSGRYEFVVYADGSSRYLSDARAIRQALRIPAGIPTAKALLRFLAWWGLHPTDRDAAAPAPSDQTRTII